MQSLPTQFLGLFICNISGDKAHLYLKDQELIAEVHTAKQEVIPLSSSQIRGERDETMPLGDLIQLVQTAAASLLFVSYHSEILRIIPRDPQEIQNNQLLKSRITFPSKYFMCIRREKTLNKLQKLLQEKQIVVILNDLSVPLKRVGKTEIATHYFEEHQKNYAHAFWMQAFDPWYFERDINGMANSLQISSDKIKEWQGENTAYLIVFDGAENFEMIQKYLPEMPKEHIIATSRTPFPQWTSVKVGLLKSSGWGKFSVCTQRRK